MDRTRRTTLLIFLGLLLAAVVAAVVLLGGLGPDGAGRDAVERRTSTDREGAVAEGQERDDADEAGDGSTGTPDGTAPEGETPESGAEEGEGEEEFSYEKETEFSILVRVVDPEGRPVESSVEILDPRYEWSFGAMPERETGVFAGHLPEAGNYAAVADRAGTRMRVSFAVAESGGTTEVEIRYPGTGSVSGTIFTSVGAVDEGVRGRWKVTGQTDLSVELIPDREPGDGPALRLSCRVGESATYRIDSVPQGDYLVCVRNKFHVSRVTVGDGEDVVHDVQASGADESPAA